MASNFSREKGLEPDEVEYLLSLNKELRRLHDSGPLLGGVPFDEAYEPLDGYRTRVESFLNR